MSDDEREDGSFEEDGGAGGGAPAEDTGLDSEGYHVISNRGKFVAAPNPLIQKREEERRKAEAKAAEAAKKAKLEAKLAAFGGGVKTRKEEDEAAKAAAEEAARKKESKVPDVTKGPLDSKMKEMMSSGIVTTKVRGVALISSSRGRGRGGGTRGRIIGASNATTGEEGASPSPTSPPSATGPAPSATADDDDDSTDSETERRRRAAAAAKKTGAGAATDATAPATTPAPASAQPPTRMERGSSFFGALASAFTSAVSSSAAPPPAPATTPAPVSQATAAEGKRRATLLVASIHQRRESTVAGMPGAGASSSRASSVRLPPALLAGLAELDASEAAEESSDVGSSVPATSHANRPPPMVFGGRAMAHGAAMSAGGGGAGLAPGSQPYRALKAMVQSWNAGAQTPPYGAQVHALETYLLPHELARVFEVDSLATFASLPAWEQVSLRKKTKLWVHRHVAVVAGAGGR